MPITIGVYDSGIGGLSVLQQLMSAFPFVNFIYFADTARMPYGQKTPEELSQYAFETISWMKNVLSVNAVISACHTSSVTAAAVLQKNWEIPVIGTYDALKDLIQKRGDLLRITFFATPATVRSSIYQALFHSMARQALCIPCPGLVEEVEKPIEERDGSLELLVSDFAQKRLQNSQAIIYGCTHYPLIDHLFQKFLPPSIERINPAAAVVQDVKNQIKNSFNIDISEENILHHGQRSLRFYTSGCPQRLAGHLKTNNICADPVVCFHQF